MGMDMDDWVQQTQIAQQIQITREIQMAQKIQEDQDIRTLILTWSSHIKKATVRSIACEILYYWLYEMLALWKLK